MRTYRCSRDSFTSSEFKNKLITNVFEILLLCSATEILPHP